MTKIVTPTAIVEKESDEEVLPVEEKKVIKKKKKIFRYYQIIWYITGVIEALLAIRFAFELLGANPFTPFVTFIYSLSSPFTYFFDNIFGTPFLRFNIFDWSALIGLIIYPLIASGLVAILKLIKPVSKEEVEQEMENI